MRGLPPLGGLEVPEDERLRGLAAGFEPLRPLASRDDWLPASGGVASRLSLRGGGVGAGCEWKRGEVELGGGCEGSLAGVAGCEVELSEEGLRAKRAAREPPRAGGDRKT